MHVQAQEERATAPFSALSIATTAAQTEKHSDFFSL